MTNKSSSNSFNNKLLLSKTKSQPKPSARTLELTRLLDRKKRRIQPPQQTRPRPNSTGTHPSTDSSGTRTTITRLPPLININNVTQQNASVDIFGTVLRKDGDTCVGLPAVNAATSKTKKRKLDDPRKTTRMESNESMKGNLNIRGNVHETGSVTTTSGIFGTTISSYRNPSDRKIILGTLSSNLYWKEYNPAIRNITSVDILEEKNVACVRADPLHKSSTQIQTNAAADSVEKIPKEAIDTHPQTLPDPCKVHKDKDLQPESLLITQPSSTIRSLEEQNSEPARDVSGMVKSIWNVLPKSSNLVPKRRRVFTNLFHNQSHDCPQDDKLQNLEAEETKRIIPSPSFMRNKTIVLSEGGNDAEMFPAKPAANTSTSDTKCWTLHSVEPSKAPSNAAAQPIPRPNVLQLPKSKKSSSSTLPNYNDNFIRLNLRNKAGSCRGARNVKSKSKAQRRYEEQAKERQEMWKQKCHDKSQFDTGSHQPLKGVDPVDDFVDGVFCRDIGRDNETTTHAPKKRVIQDPIPLCSGHQQPCKLLTVKKSGENRGRKFYACSYPRSEQCDFFQWADDTIAAAQTQLLRNRSLSGFIARQVASYMERVKSLTVPELKDLAKRHGLDPTGNKSALLLRLSIWVRDEIAKGTKGLEGDDDVDDIGICNGAKLGNEREEICDTASVADEIDDKSDSDCSDDDNLSTSSEELEVISESNQISSFCSSATNSSIRTSDFGRGKSESSTEDESIALTRMLHEFFGHTTFRDGQEWAIRRCLNKQRSLLVAPTGFGKSLCFSLTAALLDGVCIVVSPLLSLIQDQIRLLPARIPAVTLSGQMSTANMVASLDDIIRGRIKLLFVSPERLASSSFRRLFHRKWNSSSKSYERLFPEVSLFCVDEAHCMSQWAHNFRPSYLRLCSIVDLIDPKSVLAITATAGPHVIKDICRSLRIENGPRIPSCDGDCGVRINRSNRDNIDVRCLLLNSQEERLAKLIEILKKPTPEHSNVQSDIPDVCGSLSTGSVIVYVWRQHDAEVIAENIQASGISGGVVVYHGGMDAASRAKAQSRFLRGKVRICVATIAFGLGINKSDVAGVVHLYLSSSPESYIQEIGRAGRDGRPAKAIALVLKDEVVIRHSLAHTDLVSKSQVKALLLYLRCQISESVRSLPESRLKNHPIHIAFPLAMSVLGCDCKAETAETIISLLEARDGKESLLMIEGQMYDFATIAPKRHRLEKLAERELLAEAILHCAKCVEKPAGEEKENDDSLQSETSASKLVGRAFGSYSFSIAQCANSLGESAEPRHVFAALRRLQSSRDIEFVLDTSPKDRYLHLRVTNAGMAIFNNESDKNFDALVEETHNRFTSTVSLCARKVLDINEIMTRVGQINQAEIHKTNEKKSPSLTLFQELISQYFQVEEQNPAETSADNDIAPFRTKFSTPDLASDVQTILCHLHNLHGESLNGQSNQRRPINLNDPGAIDYTSLTVTKFLHGIATPSAPVAQHRNHHLFGKMQDVQFCHLYAAVQNLFQSE